MTREEAIKRFENQLKSAIVVLDSGFGTLQGESNRLYLERKEMAEFALDALREQEKRRWIPVTERLPEFGERVLCTDGIAVFEQYRAELSCVYGIWERSGMKSPMQEVTHWMPLPEPQKEGANNGW